MKMAKRSLAVFLALLMTFSVFSVSGSALWNDGDNGLRAASDGMGTITYGVDIYKDGAKVESGSTLSPGDLIEVRVSFGTDFYASYLESPVYFDSKYFELILTDGTVKTDTTDGFLAGLIKTYDNQVKTSSEVMNSAGQPASFYDTLLSEANGGRVCPNNKMTARDYTSLFPLFMKQGYAEGTAKLSSPMAAEYATYNEVIVQFGTGLGNNAGNHIIKVPYDCYYSFRLRVKEGADSNGAATTLGIPLLALRAVGSDPICQHLKSTSADTNDITTGTKTLYGHGYDMRNAEFSCVIGASAPEECTHDWGEGSVTTAATCTTAGEMTYTCAKCNETKTEVIPATGHTAVTVPGKAATCTETGLTDGSKCSVCGEILTAQTEIPMIAHTPVTVPGKAATCTETGLTDGSKCSVCNTVLTAQQTIDALGHTWGAWIVKVPATTTSEGTEERTCSVCGATETRPIEKLPVTEASYTVTVYTMDTTGKYVAGTPETRTGTIGEIVSVNADDYLTTGFTLSADSVTSAVLAESGTALIIKLDRVKPTFEFRIDNGDGTFQVYHQQEYYYGSVLTLPEPPEKNGYTFKYWSLNGTKFEGGIVDTVSIEPVVIIAVFEENIDPGAAATKEELAALNAAIAALPDAVNLYYYTDEAIMWVANALGGSYANPADFIAASGMAYTYEGPKTSVAVNAATAELTRLMVSDTKDPRYDATVLHYFDNSLGYPVCINRAESKANVTVSVVPTAINGVKITSGSNVSVMPGDDVTFGVYLTTDYYVATFCLPIVFDSNYFAPFDTYEDDGGTVKEIYSYNTTAFPGAMAPGDADASRILDLTGVSRTVTNNYDIECDTLICATKFYPTALQNEEYMNQYRYVTFNCTPKTKSSQKPLKFDNTLVASITLTAAQNIPSDGTVSTLVGCPADWFCVASARTNKLSIPRACGFKADGATPALGGGTNHPYAYSLYDVVAQFDQTYTPALSTVTFGSSHVHTEETIPGKAATCTETGLTDGVKCSVCGEILTAQEEIPALGHTEETIPGKAATCTETGLTDGVKCSVCGEILTAQEEIPALGHTEETIPGKAATCTETGHTDGVKCSVCGEILTAQEEIPALGHTEVTIPGKAATCTESGLTDGVKCSVCGEILTAQEVIPAAHKEETIPGKAATCTETGLTDGVKCSVCGEILTAQQVIPAKGHKNQTIPGKAATCTETGLTDGVKCSVCGEILTAQEVIPAKGHTWGEWEDVKPATEKEEGLEKRVCSVCKAEETRKIPKLPTKLTLTESRNGTTGTELNVPAVPYGGRNKVAFTLTSSVPGTTYEVKSNGKHAAFKIDENGNVKFVRMSILSKNKTATIVATAPDGQTATCKVTYKMKWWQYLVWMIFGTFWF